MPTRFSIVKFVKENKGVFVFVTIFLIVLEFEMFMIASLRSGEKYMLQVFDADGKMVYVTDGKNLSDFNKYYFEKTFGPFENYKVNLVTKNVPFPFRAWLVATIGVPIGIVLLLGFIVRAAATLFGNETLRRDNGTPLKQENVKGLTGFIDHLSQLNIFVIGFLIFTALLLYWIVPNALTYIGELGINTLIRLKWFFGLISLLIAGLAAWFLYLKYLLAKKAIDAQSELKKYRIALAFDNSKQPALEFDGQLEEIEHKQSTDWNKDIT